MHILHSLKTNHLLVLFKKPFLQNAVANGARRFKLQSFGRLRTIP
jgi:hypothetical protein